MDNIKQAAIDMLDAGLSVVPVRKNKKSIGGWAELQTEPMGVDEVHKRFSNAWGVGLICGEVSGGVECIDFDAHNKNIVDIYRQFTTQEGIRKIIGDNRVYTERSPRGGFHIIYRYADESGTQAASQVLAKWDKTEAMIETRGEGAYVIVAPSPLYEARNGDIMNLPVIEQYERDALIEFAKTLTLYEKEEGNLPDESGEVVAFDNTDPVSFFNWNKSGYAKKILEDIGWVRVGFNKAEGVENWRRPGKSDGISATWGKKHESLYVFTSSAEHFKQNTYYTPFQILVKIRFKNHYNAAINWIMQKYFGEEVPYIRVGVDYYKVIKKRDRYKLERVELKAWRKEEIKQDFGKDYISRIPLFDDFSIYPDNFNYKQVIDNCYNLYKPFSHTPKEGKWEWSKIMMEHIFGDQVDLGYRYLQALYLHPKRMLPILVMVSEQRQTGKTTFLNWLNMIFGDNMSNIAPEDLAGSFNHVYATSNIIAVEETLIEKAVTVEKIKALATGKFLTVNQKFVNQYKVPFYGKIILASNNEDKFARIDEEEIRFFVRKVGKPIHYNHAIEDDLMAEVPAFLHHLTTLPAIDWSRDRSGFTPEEIYNDTLRKVKDESKSGLYKELDELITSWFESCHSDRLMVAPVDLKDEWFHNNSQIGRQYIKSVLKKEFKLEPEESIIRYEPFDKMTKTGRPYTFLRENFTKTTKNFGETENFVTTEDDNKYGNLPF